MRMTPNFEDLSCEFAFGQAATSVEEDPLMKEVSGLMICDLGHEWRETMFRLDSVSRVWWSASPVRSSPRVILVLNRRLFTITRKNNMTRVRAIARSEVEPTCRVPFPTYVSAPPKVSASISSSRGSPTFRYSTKNTISYKNGLPQIGPTW